MNNKIDSSADQILNELMDRLPIPDIVKELTNKFAKLRREMIKESDRGLALYATAHIDSELESVLRKKLIGSEQHLNEIFSFNGPVGTFSAKIKLAYSLGLIDKIMMDDINTLRKIRNEFAHSDQTLSFETQKNKDLCNNLKMNVKPEDSSCRSKCMNVVAGICGPLYGVNITSEKFKELEIINLERRKDSFDLLFDYSKDFIDEMLNENYFK